MRILVLGAAAILGSCDTFPVLAEPRVLVSPYLSQYRLRGDIALQNDPGSGVQDNAAQSLRTFGSGGHEDDIGVRVDIGDGFAGLRLDYYRMSMNTSRTGVLGDDFGALLAGDTVRMASTMDEFRLQWSEPVLTTTVPMRGQELELRLAIGGVYAHRDLGMRMRTDDGARTQNVDHGGDAFYPAARLRLALRNVSLDVDYAISPGLVTGDFDGLQQDVETRLAYEVPFQDVALFAGYRWSILSAQGHQGAFGYDSDLILDGLQFGMTVGF